MTSRIASQVDPSAGRNAIAEIVTENLPALSAVITGPAAILFAVWPELAFPNAGGVILFLAIAGLAAGLPKIFKPGVGWLLVIATLANAAFFVVLIHVIYQRYR
jgi:hypothetical protein